MVPVSQASALHGPHHVHLLPSVVVVVTESCLTLYDPVDIAQQASLSSTVSCSLLKFISIESMMYLTILSSAAPFSFCLNLSQHRGLFR